MTNTPKVEQVDERTPAQFFFEIGFGACLAEAFVRNDAFPFTLTDEIINRAWAIAGEAHEDPGEFDHYLALANDGHRLASSAGEDRLREALKKAVETLAASRHLEGEEEDYPTAFAISKRKYEERQAALAPPPPDTEARAREVLAEMMKPWENYHGDIPDYDHPLRPVYESGIQYAVELLAKMLKVDDYEVCDGTEEFDGDLCGTLFNIVLAAMPRNADGDPIYPEELPAALASGRGEVERPGAPVEPINRVLTTLGLPHVDEAAIRDLGKSGASA